jgi:hypothetical protein
MLNLKLGDNMKNLIECDKRRLIVNTFCLDNGIECSSEQKNQARTSLGVPSEQQSLSILNPMYCEIISPESDRDLHLQYLKNSKDPYERASSFDPYFVALADVNNDPVNILQYCSENQNQ